MFSKKSVIVNVFTNLIKIFVSLTKYSLFLFHFIYKDAQRKHGSSHKSSFMMQITTSFSDFLSTTEVRVQDNVFD